MNFLDCAWAIDYFQKRFRTYRPAEAGLNARLDLSALIIMKQPLSDPPQRYLNGRSCIGLCNGAREDRLKPDLLAA